MDKYSDNQLVELFRSTRDSQYFEVLYHRHFKFLHQYMTWMTKDVNTSQDIVQTAFFKVLQQPEKFDLSQNFRIWILVIAKNLHRNEIRRVKNERLFKERIVQLENKGFPNDGIEINNKRKKNIMAAMNELSDQHRETLLLKYINNLTIPEIAQVMNCSEGTVKSRIFYAIRAIQKKVN